MRNTFILSEHVGVLCLAAMASCTEQQVILDPPREPTTPAITIMTEIGTFEGPPMLVDVSEGVTYVLMGTRSMENDWTAIFQLKEHHLIEGSFVVELGSSHTDSFGRAGTVMSHATQDLGKGTAFVTLGPGSATIEMNGDRGEIRGRVEGQLEVKCHVADSDASPPNEGFIRRDYDFETEYCAQFRHLLPEDEISTE